MTLPRVADDEAVRCPGCRNKLIARRLPTGELELRERGRLRAVIERGSVYCGDCGRAVTLEAPLGRVVFRALEAEPAA